jgi:hypothetical protein
VLYYELENRNEGEKEEVIALWIMVKGLPSQVPRPFAHLIIKASLQFLILNAFRF